MSDASTGERRVRVRFVNPNTTVAMTETVRSAALSVAPPHVDVEAATSARGPAAIQGAEDGAAAVRARFGCWPAPRHEGSVPPLWSAVAGRLLFALLATSSAPHPPAPAPEEKSLLLP